MNNLNFSNASGVLPPGSGMEINSFVFNGGSDPKLPPL